MFAYVIVLVSWIVLVDIFHKNLHIFKKRGGLNGSRESKETVFVKSKISTIFMVWKISSCTNIQTTLHLYINDWTNELILVWIWINFVKKKLILGICCSSEWNLCWQFGKIQETIFCELCGNPVITSIIMCGMEVTYPSSKLKYENQVWESSLRIGPNIVSEYRVRIFCLNIVSEYRVWISCLNIVSEYHVRISCPNIASENWTRKRESLKFGNR